jgi:hypothetical protein
VIFDESKKLCCDIAFFSDIFLILDDVIEKGIENGFSEVSDVVILVSGIEIKQCKILLHFF